VYLLPADVNPKEIAATSITGSQLKTALLGLPGKVLLALDASRATCPSGDPRQAPASLTDDLVCELAADASGVVVICATRGKEVSVDNDEQKLGSFAAALVAGLSGAAARSTKGEVHLHHLDVYVAQRVKTMTKGRQHPVTAKPLLITSFALAKP
jgi:hypothetical protein